MARRARQTDVVRTALQSLEGARFVSAQELHKSMRSSGRTVSLSTVYRALHELALRLEIDVAQSGSETLFRACRIAGEHHHLICRRCRSAVEIDTAMIEDWFVRIASEHGYVEVAHTFDVFGRCQACAAQGG